MEQLKPCPNPDCEDDPVNLEVKQGVDCLWQVHCGACGLTGPGGSTREVAGNFWDALPRPTTDTVERVDIEALFQIQQWLERVLDLSDKSADYLNGDDGRDDGRDGWDDGRDMLEKLRALLPRLAAIRSLPASGGGGGEPETSNIDHLCRAARHMLDMIEAQERDHTSPPTRESRDDHASRLEWDETFVDAMVRLEKALKPFNVAPPTIETLPPGSR